jgi:hypothetical protein
LRNAPNPATKAAETELLASILSDRTSLEDFGIKLRALDDQRGISLEQESKMISDSLARTARDIAAGLSLRTISVLSYLANSISSGERSIPYSIVTATDKTFDGRGQSSEGGIPPDAAIPVLIHHCVGGRTDSPERMGGA